MNAGRQGPFLLSPNTYQVKLQFGGEDGGPAAESSRDSSGGLSRHFIPVPTCRSSSPRAGTALGLPVHPWMSRSNTAYGRYPQSVL